MNDTGPYNGEGQVLHQQPHSNMTTSKTTSTSNQQQSQQQPVRPIPTVPAQGQQSPAVSRGQQQPVKGHPGHQQQRPGQQQHLPSFGCEFQYGDLVPPPNTQAPPSNPIPPSSR